MSPRVRDASLAMLLLQTLFATFASASYRGVNLGSWLLTEPWMVPTIYSSTNTTCEWDLCNALGKEECLMTLQNHWSSFITRDDFVQIKNAGLTAVRIPLGYWAVDLLPYEPYVSGQYPYLIQAVQWAGQLGLKVFIDIHGAPGSQNGWEETGLVGPIGFLDNTTNSDRTLNVLKNLTTEFSKPEYLGAVTNIEPLNEPLLSYSELRAWYPSAANVIGAGNSSGINITLSDGFFNPHSWENYNPWDSSATVPAEYLTIDTHQFWAFAPYTDLTAEEILEHVCDFGTSETKMVPVNKGVPPTLVGEWSLSTGITANSTVDAGKDQAKRTWFRMLFEAQNAVYSPNAPGQAAIGWFFWSWKTNYNIDAWSYQKGWQQGYIPSNISDPSTYAYPVKANGCLDTSYNWTAPGVVTVNGMVLATTSGAGNLATATTVAPSGAATSPLVTSASSSSGSGSSSSSKSSGGTTSAAVMASQSGSVMAIWLGFGLVSFACMLI